MGNSGYLRYGWLAPRSVSLGEKSASSLDNGDDKPTSREDSTIGGETRSDGDCGANGVCESGANSREGDRGPSHGGRWYDQYSDRNVRTRTKGYQPRGLSFWERDGDGIERDRIIEGEPANDKTDGCTKSSSVVCRGLVTCPLGYHRDVGLSD